MRVARRDPFGFERVFYHREKNLTSASISGLVRTVQAQARAEPGTCMTGDVGPGGSSANAPVPGASRASLSSDWRPDEEAILAYLAGSRLTGRTVLERVRAVPPGHQLHRVDDRWVLQAEDGPAPGPLGSLRGQISGGIDTGVALTLEPASLTEDVPCIKAALVAALRDALDSGKRPALALSGGLDSALLLALLREIGADHVPVYILTTRIAAYDELTAAMDMADRMHASVRVVEADAEAFIAALPRVVAHVEEPLYNLHPVAKLLLANAMAADGIELALSGDGADQVMRRDRSADYLPLCNSLFAAASVELRPPFLDDGVVQCLTRLPADPDKQCLRALGQALELPTRLVRGPKHSRLAPAFDLHPWMPRDRIAELADALRLPRPALQTDAERVGWTTLQLCLEQLHNAARGV